MEYNYIPKLQEWSHDDLKLNLKSLMNVHLRMFLNQSSGFVMILFSNAVGNPCIDAKGKKSEIPLNNLLLNSVLNSFGPKQSEPRRITMKKLLSLITSALLFCGLSISAPAQSIYEYLHGVAWTQIEPLPTSEDISIPSTIIITKNT